MNSSSAPFLTDEFELTLETLDQWESELDAFSNDIRQRLATGSLSQSDCVTRENATTESSLPQSSTSSTHQAMDLLDPIRNITQ